MPELTLLSNSSARSSSSPSSPGFCGGCYAANRPDHVGLTLAALCSPPLSRRSRPEREVPLLRPLPSRGLGDAHLDRRGFDAEGFNQAA